MAKPNREVLVHRGIFQELARRTQKSIFFLSQKESLNEEDIQAIKILVGVLEVLISPEKEIEKIHQTTYSNCPH